MQNSIIYVIPNQQILQPNNAIVVNPYLVHSPNFTSVMPITPPPYYSLKEANNLKVENVVKPIPLWNTGLCDCCSDCNICLTSIFCPCCLHGRNVMKLEDGSCILNCLCYLFCIGCCQTCSLRGKLRRKYNLPGSDCDDCVVSWCCHPCGLCQDAREIKYRSQSPSQQTMV